MDETRIKVKGKWAYLYRAVNSRGDAIDFHLSQTRNAKAAAKRFPDKAGCYGQAIRELKHEGKRPFETGRRRVKHLSNVVEADHGKLPVKPILGFKSMKTACAAVKGFEAMRTLGKKQAGVFQLRPGIRGEARLVERAFGIGPDMMGELMSLHGAELERIAIQRGF